MLKDEEIDITISYRNITHYRKLGYGAYLNTTLRIKTIDLPNGSHVRVTAICKACDKTFDIAYHKYIENVSRQGFYGCRKCSRQKAALTCLEKYGVENYSSTEECIIKREKTFVEKYGYKTNLIAPEHIINNKKILLEKYGSENWYDIRNGNNSIKKFELFLESVDFTKRNFDDEYIDISNDDYLSYKREVMRITKNNLKKLYENWNGLDYYDNEFIGDNFILNFNDPKYPTVDHKISILNGYKDNINFLIISSLDNLCITKRSINSSKCSMNEDVFKSKI